MRATAPLVLDPSLQDIAVSLCKHCMGLRRSVLWGSVPLTGPGPLFEREKRALDPIKGHDQATPRAQILYWNPLRPSRLW